MYFPSSLGAEAPRVALENISVPADLSQVRCQLCACVVISRPAVHEQAANVVRLYSNSDDEMTSFITAVFDGQDRISNDVTEDMTQPEIEAVLGEWVTSATGVSMDAFNA